MHLPSLSQVFRACGHCERAGGPLVTRKPSKPRIQPMDDVQQELRVLLRAELVHAHWFARRTADLRTEQRSFTEAYDASLTVFHHRTPSRASLPIKSGTGVRRGRDGGRGEPSSRAHCDPFFEAQEDGLPAHGRRDLRVLRQFRGLFSLEHVRQPKHSQISIGEQQGNDRTRPARCDMYGSKAEHDADKDRDMMR